MWSAFGIFPRILSTALWARYAYAHFIDEITVVQAGPNNLKWSGFTPHVGVSNTHTSLQCCSREAPSLGEQSIWSRLMRRGAGQKQDGKRSRLCAQLRLQSNLFVSVGRAALPGEDLGGGDRTSLFGCAYLTAIGIWCPREVSEAAFQQLKYWVFR